MALFSSKPKKYNLQEIEFEITNLKAKIASTKVNHILHLLLCILTAGFWIIIWILITISASDDRSEYEKSLKDFYRMKNNVLKIKEVKKRIQDKKDALEQIDNTEKLIKLSEMLEKGLLTEEEFKKYKEELKVKPELQNNTNEYTINSTYIRENGKIYTLTEEGLVLEGKNYATYGYNDSIELLSKSEEFQQLEL